MLESQEGGQGREDPGARCFHFDWCRAVSSPNVLLLSIDNCTGGNQEHETPLSS